MDPPQFLPGLCSTSEIHAHPSVPEAWQVRLAGVDKEKIQALSETPASANHKLSGAQLGKKMSQKELNRNSLYL